MNDNLIEIRNRWGMPMHAPAPRTKAQPIKGSDVNTILIMTLVIGAVGGAVLTYLVMTVCQ